MIRGKQNALSSVDATEERGQRKQVGRKERCERAEEWHEKIRAGVQKRRKAEEGATVFNFTNDEQ